MSKLIPVYLILYTGNRSTRVKCVPKTVCQVCEKTIIHIYESYLEIISKNTN